jgi:hypothetical protein
MNASNTASRFVDGRNRERTPRPTAGRPLDGRGLREQNRVYAGTGGVSANNRAAGFVPGFLNTRTGVAVTSRFANGRPAPVHVLDGLPEEWIAERSPDGMATKACQGVVAGFVRLGRFYSRDEAARALAA